MSNKRRVLNFPNHYINKITYIYPLLSKVISSLYTQFYILFTVFTFCVISFKKIFTLKSVIYKCIN